MTHIKAIAAMSQNRVVGLNNTIPWHLPKDFQWFKKATMGGILVMGRTTYESIGRPLPGRSTYVLSRTPRDIPKVTTVMSLDELPDTDEQVWLAGGGDIYKQFLPQCEELYLTRVHRECEGDTFFPEFEHLFYLKETLSTSADFDVELWVRRHDD
jgi:dihydrofolate reductase